MIDRYLDRGTLLALYDGGLRAVCVVTKEAPGVFEIKKSGRGAGLSAPGLRPGHGSACGRRLPDRRRDMPPGGHWGQSLTLPFYRACGFRESHRVPNFFLQFYDHPIYEGGRLLSDMVYLSMEL